MPRTLEIIASLDPLTYGVDGPQGAFIRLSHFGAALDIAVLSAVGAALVAADAYLFSRIQF